MQTSFHILITTESGIQITTESLIPISAEAVYYVWSYTFAETFPTSVELVFNKHIASALNEQFTTTPHAALFTRYSRSLVEQFTTSSYLLNLGNRTSDFNATIAITNPSPLTKQMLGTLPSDYNSTSLNTGTFNLLYGTGYELENLKQELLQAEANNYLYSPDTQQGSFNVTGVGIYLIEFDIPFVTPPLNVSIGGADTTDVFIESTSRFNMIINVQTPFQDTLQYRASGFVGAASNKYLGDSLYNNFGALYGLSRIGSSQIDNSYVNFYSNVTTFVTVQNIIPVQTFNGTVSINQFGTVTGLPPHSNNSPPRNVPYVQGVIRPTSAVSSPQATHELIDKNSGNLIALLDASATSTATQAVSAFYLTTGSNMYLPNPEVYIVGPLSTFTFDPWDQPSYIQEVFRADNVYRRILAGINKSLALGPTVNGVANLVEALVAQPFIPHEIWDQSDFRIFKDSEGLTYPKFNNGLANSQYETYPCTPPTVEVKRVTKPWAPGTLTYTTQPNIISFETPVTQTINVLNNATQFDITNELTRQLRLGIDVPLGGVINWNYQNSTTTIPVTGSTLYEQNNYVFLNNPGDSIAGINLFWYAQQGTPGSPTGYQTFGPLYYGRDYFVIPTTNFLLPNGTYELPSELLVGYNCNSLVPYVNGQKDKYGNYSWLGAELVTINQLPNTTPSLPPFAIQLDLRTLSIHNYNRIATKMPTNPFDFILYSYGLVTLTQAQVNGSFRDISDADSTHTIAAYYDADTTNAYQPIDSPFASALNNLSPTALAQSSFAKMVTPTNYEYILTMIGGQVTFNKTIAVNTLLAQATTSTLSSPGIFILQALNYVSGAASTVGQVGTNQYTLSGTVQPILSSSGERYFQFDFGNYVLVDTHGHPIAIFDTSSLVNFASHDIQSGPITVTGVVLYTLWDTRIPATQYRTGSSPVFQTSANFSSTVIPFSPDPNIPGMSFLNDDFLVRIEGLPLGNQQTVSASWTFNILPTSATSPLTTTLTTPVLGFSDTLVSGTIQYGIMSLFTGLPLRVNGLDHDGATYDQNYLSPSFSGYFLNYNDYTNSLGGKLLSSGDTDSFNTLTIPVVPSQEPKLNTILNFFSPKYGFISLSILPNMNFFMTSNGAPVSVIRPNNNGIALQIDGNSYAGLVFYGSNLNKIVDKPTRLIVDFTYGAANAAPRKKIVEIDDGGYANWVDGNYPDTVQSGSTFYLAGNQFKYPHEGYAQAINNKSLSPTFTPPASAWAANYTPPVSAYIQNAGQYYNRLPTNGSQSSFLTDPSQNYIATIPDKLGEPGPPLRYRRAPVVNATGSYESPSTLALTQGYYNTTPGKTAFIQFDLSSFPIDAIVNTAILELYFCSGFTIKQGKDVDFELNKNTAWQKSRLSGNGKTFVQTLTDNQGNSYNINKSLQNMHWRKNFFEIVIPYAFNSEPTDEDYGIQNLFTNTFSNALPTSKNPQPNLEYLGYINIDEIDTATLTVSSSIETSVGFTNIILSTDSVVYNINGILHFNPDGTLMNSIHTANGTIYDLNSTTVIGNSITQANILPNIKVLVFPFGTSTVANLNVFFYGYCSTVLAATNIGFTQGDINVYQQILNYVQPLYSEYVVKLLESDTYFAYTTFGKESQYENTVKDIAH